MGPGTAREDPVGWHAVTAQAPPICYAPDIQFWELQRHIDQDNPEPGLASSRHAVFEFVGREHGFDQDGPPSGNFRIEVCVTHLRCLQTLLVCGLTASRQFLRVIVGIDR